MLPPWQQADQLGAAAAKLWASNPSNAMTLKKNLDAADKDGSGTIDVSEFKDLVAQSGARVSDIGALFAQIDKDGDGELTEEELRKLGDARRNYFKASNA